MEIRNKLFEMVIEIDNERFGMQLFIKLFRKDFSILIGRKTSWFQQVAWLSIHKLEFVNHGVDWAEILFEFPRFSLKTPYCRQDQGQQDNKINLK